VSGELVFEREALSDFGAGIDAYWRYEKFIRHNESESGSVIGVTGALYALKTAYFKPIPHETILDDVLIPMQVALQGMRVTFEKGAIAFDTPSENLAKEQMRKVRTLAGNFQILALCPDLLRIWRNPLWWRYGSHKVLRLLAPLFLTLAFISNALLIGQSSAYQALFAAQLVFYASAVMGMLIPALGRHQIVRLATSFITLNWFVLQGFRHYLTKADAHIWQRGEDTQTLSSSNKKTP
jgi:biofilm PGA synthesis N-glycosyltransferase PgaC